ncbi:MAG TPA: hypothetical protein P5216_01850, partial [Bacteroidota bacterium]|nr:hypothetical protein [Bacteroidota bacterium]
GTDYTTGHTLYTNATGGNKITYSSANNDQYIEGKVALTGTIATGTAYTLNNAQTQVTFNTSPECSSPYGFAMYSAPNQVPDNSADFDLTRDLKRNVRIDYCGTAGVLSNLRIGYVASDKDGTFAGNEGNLRFEEAWGDNTGDRQKVTGGAGIATNSNGADPKYVQLITEPTIALKLDAPTDPGGTIYELSRGSNIILTSKTLLFIAVNSGRWTNPNTWDEGAIPSSTDNTELRTLVYAGIKGPAYGTPALNNETAELSKYPDGQIANSITIPTGFTNASLIVGNEDNGDGYNMHTALSGTVGGIAAGVYNYNATANNGNWNDKNTAPGLGNTVNGLFISSIKNSAYTNNPVIFGTAQIINAGTISNYQVIEIGQ